MQKITRRNLAALAAGGAAALGTADSATPAQTQPAAAPADELAAARKQVARNLETLSKYELPMSTEPAFVFKA